MAAAQLAPYRIVAFNTAHASENKIHDDATARRFGFSGGLVPGVDVYGYMTHMPVEHWGRSWLERGTADCRLYKPVYHGDEAVVTATGASGSLEITLESRGARCATGIAGLPSVAPSPPDVAAFRAVPQRRDRAPADERSVAVGTWLGLDPYPVTREMAEQYLAASSETAPIYAAENLVHPREILRACNFVLSRNVLFGPWIHTGSRIQNYAAVPVGALLSARAVVTANLERKGHQFVEIDALVLSNDERPVARVAHVAIYRLRQAQTA